MAKMRYDERVPNVSAKGHADARSALSRLYDTEAVTPAGQLRQEGRMIAGLASPRGRSISLRYGLILLTGLAVVAAVVVVYSVVMR